MPAVYGLKKKITRKSRSYRRSEGGEGGLEDFKEYYMVFRESRRGSAVVNRV